MENIEKKHNFLTCMITLNALGVEHGGSDTTALSSDNMGLFIWKKYWMIYFIGGLADQ